MNLRRRCRRLPAMGKVALLLCAAVTAAAVAARPVAAGWPWKNWCWNWNEKCAEAPYVTGEDLAGHWYWLGSPEEQKRLTMGQFNRYCVRCHGSNGRGVWDVPHIPDFTNPRWQASRSDPQLVRIILEGRGAVMPAFRGTLTLEEAWWMARYLRSFLPSDETTQPEKADKADKADGAKDRGPMPKPER
jgi:mono/diheme cytochrome c family protein